MSVYRFVDIMCDGLDSACDEGFSGRTADVARTSAKACGWLVAGQPAFRDERTICPDCRRGGAA